MDKTGIPEVRGIREFLALAPRAVFPGASSKPAKMRRTPMAPQQMLPMASTQEHSGRPPNV